MLSRIVTMKLSVMLTVLKVNLSILKNIEKKLNRLSVKCDLKWESSTIFTHRINIFQIEKVIDTWVKVSLSCQKFCSCHILVRLDSYSMIDLVSIFFVKFFDLIFCTKLKHHHVVSMLEEVDETNLKIYDFYHLRLSITDCFNHTFNFTCLFLAVDQNPRDSQVLLDWPALQDFKINICNKDDMWDFEFEQQSKIMMLSWKQFVKKLTSQIKVLELCVIFKSCETDNTEITDDSLVNILKKLHLKYRDFFDVDKAEQQSSHQLTDHVIELKSDFKSLYMWIYNMFLTELKALDEYLIKALIKNWIQEFKNSADTSVLFISRKSDKLQFCIDYCVLNIMTIKNYYSLSLINKLLNWLDSSVMFLKINLWNAYHHIHIHKEDENVIKINYTKIVN